MTTQRKEISVAAGPQVWTEDIIAERFAQGRGQGIRENYIPWIRIQEFASIAPQTRVPCLLFPRSIHTFSYVERAMYLFLEFQGGLWDYREQFPMDRRVTMGAAKALRIRHPRYPKSRIPMVMTIDALVTSGLPNGSTETVAWDAKPTKQLLKRRIQDKLMLHKAYCKHIGVEHRIFTEKSVSQQVINNIDLTRSKLPRDGETGVAEGLFTRHTDELVRRMSTRRWRMPVWQFCARYDQEQRLEPGSALRAYYVLIWTRRIQVNLDVQDLASANVPMLARSLNGKAVA
jgi:hypothetical protein